MYCRYFLINIRTEMNLYALPIWNLETLLLFRVRVFLPLLQHPDNSVEAGEEFYSQVYTALRASKYWEESLLIVRIAGVTHILTVFDNVTVWYSLLSSFVYLLFVALRRDPHCRSRSTSTEASPIISRTL